MQRFFNTTRAGIGNTAIHRIALWGALLTFTLAGVAAEAITLTAVQSRKAHGAAGNFDIALDTTQNIGGAVTVEPRAIGAGHQLVFQFDVPISVPGTASAVDEAGAAVDTAPPVAAGNEVVVTLAGVADNKFVTLSLANVNGTLSPSPVSLGFLLGDVDNTHSVNSSDITGVKSRSGQTTTALNFKFDVNATGTINSADIATVKARSGRSLPVASRIEAAPRAVLLVGVGDDRKLSARLLSADGAPFAGVIGWASSDPAVVSVDSVGTVRALVSAGSARVTASSGSLQSASILITIAQPMAGAMLLADSQIISGPTAVDPTATPTASNAYEVVLPGAPALSVGMLVIASESANVAGRVVSVIPEGANQRVRLVAVPPNQLFSDLDFKDTVDLAPLPFEIPPDLAASYDIVQTGRTFVFTPKPGAFTVVAPRASSAGEPATAAVAIGTSALPTLPPFKECEFSAGFGAGLPVPLALSAVPSFEITINGSARSETNTAGTKIILTGQPSFKFTSVLEIKSAFEAKFGCKLVLGRTKYRAPGWAGLFFGGDVEWGVGFEVGGKVTLFNARVGGSVKLSTTITATLDCPVAPDSCSLGGDVSTNNELTPILTAPSLNQIQFEPAASLFGFVSLEAGNADVQQLQFKAIEIKAGAKLSASLAPEALQIDNLDPTTGRSKYALAFNAEVGPGIKLGEFLTYLGLAQVVPLKLAFTADLGTSPTAASVTADRARYLPGERATVAVKLVPASTLFPSGLFYNVGRIVLIRKTGLFTTEVLADQAATAGQTDFTLGFVSTSLLNADEIFAFVVTKALPLDPPMLELAAALAFTISTASLPDATAGFGYSATLIAAGGTAPYSWTANGLPSSLSINAQTGVISGTPTTAGTATITVSVTSAEGFTAQRTISLFVKSLDITGTFTGNYMRFVDGISSPGGTVTATFSKTGDLVSGDIVLTPDALDRFVSNDSGHHTHLMTAFLLSGGSLANILWESTDPSCPGGFFIFFGTNGASFSIHQDSLRFNFNVLESDCHKSLRNPNDRLILLGFAVRN